MPTKAKPVRKKGEPKRGPMPERLKIVGIDWKDAVKKSFEKKPATGRPKP